MLSDTLTGTFNRYLLSICYIIVGIVQALRTEWGMRKTPMAPVAGDGEEEIYKAPSHITGAAFSAIHVGD